MIDSAGRWEKAGYFLSPPSHKHASHTRAASLIARGEPFLSLRATLRVALGSKRCFFMSMSHRSCAIAKSYANVLSVDSAPACLEAVSILFVTSRVVGGTVLLITMLLASVLAALILQVGAELTVLFLYVLHVFALELRVLALKNTSAAFWAFWRNKGVAGIINGSACRNADDHQSTQHA